MGLAGASFPIGSILGIPIRVHFLLPIILVLQCVFYTINTDDQARGFFYAFVLYGPILFLTVLIHEFGHSLAARSVGGRAHSILLWPLGGLAYCGHDEGPKADLWVTFAGPLTHIPQALFWVLMVWLSQSDGWDPQTPRYREDHFWDSIAWSAVWINVGMMLFNLLIPAYPLDGGRIFADIMLIAGVPIKLAAQIVIAVAAFCGIAMVVLGFLGILFGYMGVAIGAFILINTYGVYQALSADQIEQHPMFKKPSSEPVGTAMYNVETETAPPGPARV